MSTFKIPDEAKRDAIETRENFLAEAVGAVEELDCLYINGDRHPFGGIPADEWSATRRAALQEAIASIRALSAGVRKP